MKFNMKIARRDATAGWRLASALLLAALLTALAASPAVAQLQPPGPWPEACSRIASPDPVTVLDVATVGTSLEVTYTVAGLASKQVVVVFNGNGYSAAAYDELADHLVQQDFIVANAHRPNSGDGGNAAYVLDAVDEVLDALGFVVNDPALSIGLLGHSQGGRLILEAAALNLGEEVALPIHALVALAPAANASSVMNDWGMPPYFTLYGSQDEDLDGYQASVKEAFRAYDQVGSESSTTCNSPPCVATNPRVDKTMAFAYGADHAGLVGIASTLDPTYPQATEYLSSQDQLCLSKAYSTAFFKWHLDGDSSFKGFIRDEWRPVRIKSMKTYQPDGVGNAAGEPLRLYHQISPRERKVIQNFQAGTGAPDHSPSVLVDHAAPLIHSPAPHYIRHNTGAAFIGWPAEGGIRFARWIVPFGSRVASTYSHLSVRIGQVAGLPMSQPFANIPATDLTVYLGIVDTSNNTDMFRMDVPYPDPYLENLSNARTAMNTFRFEVEEFEQDLDLDNIEYIFLIIPSGSQGTVLIDSIEWHRD